MKSKKTGIKKIPKTVKVLWWTPRDFVKNPICWGEK